MSVPYYEVYAEQLSKLGHGLPLWEPAPSGYDIIQIADVGHLFRGSFSRLFNAALPATHPSNARGVPDNFEPIPLEDVGPDIWKTQPRLPTVLQSGRIQTIGLNGSTTANQSLINMGGSVQFKSSATEGAILLTNHETYRADTQELERMTEYGRQNVDSWLQFARKKGRQVKRKDIMFVTGFDVTAEYAMAAFSNTERNISLEFQAATPIVSANLSVWGSWTTPSSVHYNCGPQVRIPPGLAENMELLTTGEPSDNLPSADENQACVPPKKYNQCVFVRKIQFPQRFRKFPRVMKAAAGPHDLGSGDRYKDSAPMLSDLTESDSSDGDTIIDTPPVRDPLDHIIDYIFERSNVERAIVHDNDLIQILKKLARSCDPIDQDMDWKSMIETVAPSIIYNKYGDASVYINPAPGMHTPDAVKLKGVMDSKIDDTLELIYDSTTIGDNSSSDQTGDIDMRDIFSATTSTSTVDTSHLAEMVPNVIAREGPGIVPTRRFQNDNGVSARYPSNNGRSFGAFGTSQSVLPLSTSAPGIVPSSRYQNDNDDPREKIRCPHCNNGFDRQSSLETHLLVHTKTRTSQYTAPEFVCPEEDCNKSFAVKSNLTRHQNSVHGTTIGDNSSSHQTGDIDVRNIFSATTSTGTVDTSYLGSRWMVPNVIAREGPGIVPTCRYQNDFRAFGTLQSVLPLSASAYPPNDGHSFGVVGTSQSVSPLSTSAYPSNNGHSSGAFGTSQSVLPPSTSAVPPSRYRNDNDHPTSRALYECPQCDTLFSRQADLEVHIRGHINMKGFICPVCEKKFVAKSNLTRHLTTHLDPASFDSSASTSQGSSDNSTPAGTYYVSSWR